MSFTNYLEDENDKPYFTKNSLAYYYDKMEGFAKAVEGSAKALNLTKEEIEQRIALRLSEWDKNLESFDGSVEKLLTEWVDDGTLTHVIDSTLIDQKIAPVAAQLAEKSAIQKETVTIKIPTDFADLQLAINELSTRKNKQGVIFNLSIEAGHKLTSGVKVSDGDYGHFRISAVEPVVYLAPTFPTTHSIVEGIRAVMPVLACLVDGQNLYGHNGYSAVEYSRGYIEQFCGVRNIKGNQAHSVDMYGIGLMVEASEVYAYRCVFTGNRINAWATRTSRVFADTSDFKNATGEHGVFCSRSSLMSISGSIITGCAINALTAYRSIVTAIGSTDFSNAGSKCIQAASGATVIVNQRYTATPKMNNSDYGIYCVSSRVIADFSIIDGNRYGVFAINGDVNVDNASIKNSKEVGIKAEDSSKVHALGATILDSGVYNVMVRFMSRVNLRNATLTGGVTKDMMIDGGSDIMASGATTTRSTVAGVPNIGDSNVFASNGGFNFVHPNKGIIWTNNIANAGVGKNLGVSIGSAFVEVVFPIVDDTTSYAVSATPSWNTTYWISNKTINGFRINFGTPPSSLGYLDWTIKK